MKKLSILLVLAALGLAACGSGGGVAATVNGVDIRVSDVEGLLNPAEGATIPKEEFAGALGFLVQQEIVSEAAEADFGIVIEDSEIDAEANTIFEEAQGEGQTKEEFLEAQGITEDLLRRFAHSQLLVGEISELLEADVEEPTQQEIDGVISEAEALYCASHILVATEQEATDVAARLEAGEEFAALAGELSTDTGSGAQGGDIGCSAPDVYDPAFAAALTAAEVDVPTDPVESQFGWHIILLREDEVPTADEARATLTSEAVNEAANTWFTDQFEKAEVSVDSEYGTWQATPTPQVVPPAE
ncbi:MAG TPA: peptidylprolyl isomerase [Acidimicrobiia bacterium]|nr:peptidylprolyl isomerase [Acidimicrobiia bacterium]